MMEPRNQPIHPAGEERPTDDEEPFVELSDDQLEHVVGGLERPAVGPRELDSLLSERRLDPDA